MANGLLHGLSRADKKTERVLAFPHKVGVEVGGGGRGWGGGPRGNGWMGGGDLSGKEAKVR